MTYQFSLKDEKTAMEWYRRGADLGHEQAMCNLARMYILGKGVEENLEKAIEWYQKVYEKKERMAGVAARKIGDIYLHSYDYETGAEWYRRSADLGDDRSLNNLGEMYRDGRGVPKDPDKAMECFLTVYERQGEEAGAAANYIGGLYECRSFDDEKAFEWYLRGAEWGDEDAMYNLANMYEYGTFVEKDIDKAIEWYRKSYEQQGEKAQDAAYKLRDIYNHLLHEEAQGFEWNQRGAAWGDDEAMYNIGVSYKWKDKDKALEWFRMAYEKQGEKAGAAAYQIGCLLDNDEAFTWFLRSAERGNEKGMYAVGTMYRDGNGVAKDVEKAMEWFRKAYEMQEETAEDAAEAIVRLGGKI